MKLLSGDKSALKHIADRRKAFEKYKALPPLPSGNAAARLKTGDRVLVDGGQGVVNILD